jgi:hypothetical protein
MATGKQKGSVAIQSLLHDDKSTFAALYQRSTELQIFQEKLKAKLPSPLCDHFILANIDKTTLTLHTDSPAWAARFRFITPDILSHAQKLCNPYSPKTIRIKVVPPVSSSKQKKRTVNLSSKNAKLILDTANSITDPVLRDALIRLSQHKS